MDWCPPKADPTGVGSCSAHQHAHSQEEQSAKLGESPALPSKWPQPLQPSHSRRAYSPCWDTLEHWYCNRRELLCTPGHNRVPSTRGYSFKTRMHS